MNREEYVQMERWKCTKIKEKTERERERDRERELV